MAQTSQVVLFHAAGKPFEHRQIEQPELKVGQALVRVTHCTICGSDLHTYTGRRSGPSPCVLGHEIIGRIEDWGGADAPVDFHGKPLERGQRVTWSLAVGCGECFFCRNALPQKCVSLFKYGHEAASDQRGPTGGLSQFCYLVAGTPIFPLPDALPDTVACPANCATATVTAALRLAQETRSIQDQTVLVTGMGILGLTACAMLRECGAKTIVAADTSRARLSLAERFGATHAIEVEGEPRTRDELQAVIEDCTQGRGADLALEFSGASSAVDSGLARLRTGGTAIWVGSVFPDAAIPIHPEQLVRRMLTVRGVHNYSPQDLESALRFLLENHARYPFAELVSKTFALTDAQKAFEHAIEAKAVRVAVVPN